MQDWNWNDGHMGDGWGIAMMLIMLSIWLLFIGAMVVAAVWAVRQTRPASAAGPSDPAQHPHDTTGSAEQILAERLARGDIDAEEYRTRLSALLPRTDV